CRDTSTPTIASATSSDRTPNTARIDRSPSSETGMGLFCPLQRPPCDRQMLATPQHAAHEDELVHGPGDRLDRLLAHAPVVVEQCQVGLVRAFLAQRQPGGVQRFAEQLLKHDQPDSALAP